MFGGSTSTVEPTRPGSAAATPEREDAVLVFGASGKSGSALVKKLLDGGRQVVAAVRSEDKAASAGLTAGPSEEGYLFLTSGVDVTDSSTLTPELFQGVSQVVSCLGPIYGQLVDGSRGAIDNMTSERVDGDGVAELSRIAAQHLSPLQLEHSLVMDMASEDALASWAPLDDSIMGGTSASGLTLQEGGVVRWAGEVIVEGGGFCGCRSARGTVLDLSSYDGIRLRVKGDGSTFKMNLKTPSQREPESTWQATFDTAATGDWQQVFIPWHEFLPVVRARHEAGREPMSAADAAGIETVGFVLSRFEYNKMPNPRFTPGTFELLIDGGVSAYTAPRPQLVLLTSAGVERNALIGDDVERRKKDIPIVQLNPGATLNHKYRGELALRAAGLPYTVLRAVGLTNDEEGGPYLLEADQGDTISGRISRGEVAGALAHALTFPAAVNKTFELRRNEAVDGKGLMTDAQMRRMMLRLAPDEHRWRVGLPPFPLYAEPPPPPTPERLAEILSDARVKSRAEEDAKERAQASTTGASEAVAAEPSTAAKA